MTSGAAPVLQVDGISKSYKGVAALDNVTFSLREGSVLGLIGPNGSGKSTAIDCVTGFIQLDSGRVLLDGKPITGRAPQVVARKGIARTFQTIKLYDALTLDDHIELTVWGLRDRRAKSRRAGVADAASDWLVEFGLDRLRSAPAAILSYGQKKLLALATVLAVSPRIAVLDEPLAGVNPAIIDVIGKAINTANRAGQTFLIVEHNVEFVTERCDTVVVLDAGSKLAEGDPSIIWDNPAVYEAFLGRKPDERVV